jgi:putative transcriptional regulator
MNDKRFDELLESVREGGRILRGKAPASRAFKVDGADVKRIRASYNLSQDAFAAMMGISIGTLRNWEQGRRDPEGSARVLLRVAERHPEALLDIVQASPRKR